MAVYKDKTFTKTDLRWRNKSRDKFKRKNRKNPTKAEKILGDALKKHLEGRSKVIPQKAFYTPKSFVLVDFWLKAFNVAIEVDGEYHKSRESEDLERDRVLASRQRARLSYPIPVLRFTNEEVEEDLPVVLLKIDSFLEQSGDRYKIRRKSGKVRFI
jgi:very-short-patch-repair endonuclease